MKEKIIRKLSGIENLLGIAKGRIIIGIIFIIYGIIFLSINSIDNLWVKISISLAFFGLGFMFIFDGQSILREYFRTGVNKK